MGPTHVDKVSAAVIAPFVVAALLLPWVCGAAALAGLGQRVGGAIEDFSNDLSGSSSLEQPVAPLVEESVQPTPEESNLVAPSEEEVFPLLPQTLLRLPHRVRRSCSSKS